VNSAETVKLLNQLLFQTKNANAATIAAGIIAASGRAYSVAEAMKVLETVTFAMYPAPGHGLYESWVKQKDEHLNKVQA